MRQHVARTRLLRFLPLEAASSQLVVSSDLGELEASMAGICTVPRPRPVAWGSWAGISPPSIDLTDHGGGLVVAVGGRPRDAWAPLLRPPTHTGLGRSHVRSALGRWKVHGAPYVRLARLGPRSISPCFYGLARPSIGYRAGRLRRSPCQGSRFMVPIDDPEHNMYVSSFKLSICDRRADRPVSGCSFTVRSARRSQIERYPMDGRARP